MPVGRTIVVLAGAASLAVGGAAYAASGHHAAHSQKADANASMTAASEPTSPDTDNIQSGDQTTPDAAAQVNSAAEQTSPDTDNIQSGDQTAPDNGTVAGAGGQAEGGSAPPDEQAGESDGGSEVAGNDGPGGHADEPGNPNADHQFQGQE